jgi:membrane protease subunit HflC
MLRSLDTLSSLVNGNTNLVLRTDAAPFQALVKGPAGLDMNAAPARAAASPARHAK